MKNIILIAISSILLVSCMDDLAFENPHPTEQEVKFTAKVSLPQTKTLYGDETKETIEGQVHKYLKLKWVHDDQITVFGTGCGDGRQQADYYVKTYAKVNGEVTDQITPATPNSSDGQNYADELVKVGSYGVQWGEDATNSDFYAVYPPTKGKFSSADTYATVPVTIAPIQYLSFRVVEVEGDNANNTETIMQGVPYDNGTKKYGMSNALMYACTPNASASNASVDLAFKPFSTVLKFTIPTWYGNTENGLQQEQTGKSILVNSIKLTAPKNVFGDCTIKINRDSGDAEVPSGTEGTANEMTIMPSERLEWTYGQKLEFSVFSIPLEDVPMKGWKVAIEYSITTTNTSDGSTTTTTKTQNFTINDTSATLKACQIHNVKLTSGFAVDAIWEFKKETWLETVPRNVYISDISLPGSWYALDEGYQSGTLQDQYNAGIRAFNIDCRLTLSPGNDVTDYDDPNRQYKDNINHLFDNEGNFTTDVLTLACAGTEKEGRNTVFGIETTPNGKMASIKTTVSAALIELGELAATKPNEYVEAIITVSQKPKDVGSITGNDYVFGTVNAQMVLTAITEVLNSEAVSPYIAKGKNGLGITPETTLRDVAGKVVVKVNINTSDTNIRKWQFDAPMLISEGSMAEEVNESQYISAANFTSMNTSSMYWSNIYSLSTSSSYKAMKYYYHQAQNTQNITTVDQRKTAILDILSNSYEIYHKNTHDAMFQIGIGGWTSDTDQGKTNLSSQLKPFVYNIINSMLNEVEYDPGDGNGSRIFKPAPVGAVLMNHSTAGTTHNTQALIDAIIELNGTYFLNRDNDQAPWD